MCALAVVELWDSVEPQSIAQLIGVVIAIDPALALPYLSNGDDLAKFGRAAARTDNRTVGDTFARQLEYPPH
ncbi:hypothetical protein STBA_02430 [Streptomyces sp. MP131-18]|nr:hypothetical protein STBA_02430 [Streptomyces sp. MP131-18]